MARSYLKNAVDVALAEDVGGADSTITVSTPELLPEVPFYLVVDPFSNSLREYMYCTGVVDEVLSVDRNLDGSEGTSHLSGDIVRITYMSQHLDDLWDGIADVPQQTYLHEDLTDIAPDQHHERFTEEEGHAIGIVAPPNPEIGTVWVNPNEPPEAEYLPLTGGVMEGLIAMDNHRIEGLQDPIYPGDAVSKSYLEDNSGGGQGDWYPITLESGWEWFGGGWASPRYRLNDNGTVDIQGMVSGGEVTSSTPVFYLPANMIPNWDLVVVSYASTGPCRINVRGSTYATPGMVQTEAGWSQTWTAMNISFGLG